ncbi:MAG TPA: UDP-N-acetylmuramoyl-L-alanine--D-glutamate ligase [Candidatus Colwellbacteria bacterium]|nr:UDP-N-acetylmuramoyl-L-alanine--D-glutamate ligase [Candidatus Colwellbacteria bacterium]
MKLAILGFGREGKALKAYLRKKYPKEKITILDREIDPDYLRRLDDFDIVFRSPGVPYNLPEIQNALRKGTEFSSATKVFFDEVRKNKKGLIIGITGTKGKGTTSTLLYDILKAAKKDAYLAGNIGTPALTILSKLKKDSMSVIELSSFQLQGLGLSPDIAVVLDVFPDHLDVHRSVKEYLEAKSEIAKHQKKSDVVFYNKDNKNSFLIAKKSKGKKIPVSEKKFDLFSPADLKIAGPHNFKNAVMAAEIGLYLGIDPGTIKATVKKYKGLPYRLELVAKKNVGGKSIEIYNDSASTNPETTAAAVKSFKEPIFLIAGGKDKNLDYGSLGATLQKSSVREAILFGENKEKIKKAIGKSKVKIILTDNLIKALAAAFEDAKKYLRFAPDEKAIIVFSPGATSFDMFKDYIGRGKKFSKLAKSLD